MKTCSSCKQNKDKSEFYACASRPDGLRCECKECGKARTRQYTAENPEKIRESNAKWRSEHPDYMHEYNREYYNGDIDAQRERAREYYWAHDEERKQYAREYRTEYPEKGREWARANRDKRRVTEKKHYESHREQVLAKHNRRRAKKIGAKGSHTAVELQGLEQKCQCCGTTEKLTIDHVIALNSGGSNSVENLQMLCKSCNSSKGDRKRCKLAHKGMYSS